MVRISQILILVNELKEVRVDIQDHSLQLFFFLKNHAKLIILIQYISRQDTSSLPLNKKYCSKHLSCVCLRGNVSFFRN